MFYKSYVYSPYHGSFLDCRRFYKDKYSCIKRLSSRGHDNRLMMLKSFDDEKREIVDIRYFRVDKENGIIWLNESQVFLIELSYTFSFPMVYSRSFKKGVLSGATS